MASENLIMDTSNSEEYLSFELGDEIYAINILNVKEIKTYGEVTQIANSPAFIKGVMNLRGIVVPILDLRIKFNLGALEYTSHTTVIITTIGERHVGIVVDGVSDVLNISPDDISGSPEFNSTLDVEYLDGIATIEDHMVILVNINKLLNHNEMGLVDETAAKENKESNEE
jgi:purine-binding chemotaxis protein CheW